MKNLFLMLIGLVTSVSMAQSLPPGLPAPSQNPRVSASGTVHTTSGASGMSGSSTQFAFAASHQYASPSIQRSYVSPGNPSEPGQSGGVWAYVSGIAGRTDSYVSGTVTGAGAGQAVAHATQSGSVVAGFIQPLSSFDFNTIPPTEQGVVGESTGVVSVKVDSASVAAVTGNGSAGVESFASGGGSANVYASSSPDQSGLPTVYGDAQITHNTVVDNIEITGNGNVDGSYATVDAQAYYNAQYEGSPGATEHLKSLP